MIYLIYDAIRYAFWLLGRRYVVLIYFDGRETVSPVRFRGGRATAAAISWSGSSILLDGGKVSKEPCYIQGWRPYVPLTREWPTYDMPVAAE